MQLQILSLKGLPGQNGQPSRNKLIMSDGVHFMNAMLATQMNSLVENKTIKELSVLNVTESMINDVNGRKIMIVLGCTVAGTAGGKLGSPKRFDPSAPSAPSSSSSSSFANQKAAAPPAQTPKMQSSRPAVARSPDLGCTPIMQINPYANRWKIKGRITDIQKMKHYSNAKGDGKIMKIVILDKHGDDIAGTFFNELAGKYHPQDPDATQALQKGAMYTFTGGRVKVANSRWNTCKSEYEITFSQNCEIVQVEDDGGVQKVSYDRFSIAQIEHTEPGDRTIDILGVVLGYEPHSTFTSKKGNEVTKRELTIGDESGRSIRCTLWGEQAFTPDAQFDNNPIVLVTKAKIGDYGGRTLSGAFSGGALEFNPSFAPEMNEVKNWLTSGGAENCISLSTAGGMSGGGGGDSVEKRRLMADIDNDNLGESGVTDAQGRVKADFINVKAYVTFVKSEEGKYCYPADPETRKKLTFDQSAGPNGMWRNEGTGKEYESPDWSYVLSCKIEDYTGGKYVTAFNKDTQAQALVGYTANELKAMEKEDGNDNRVTKLLDSLCFKEHKFVLMCKMDDRSEEPRKNIQVFKVQPIVYAEENTKLIAAIEQYA